MLLLALTPHTCHRAADMDLHTNGKDCVRHSTCSQVSNTQGVQRGDVSTNQALPTRQASSVAADLGPYVSLKLFYSVSINQSINVSNVLGGN